MLRKKTTYKNKETEKYRYISHTADFGIKSKAASLKGLFENLALGLIDYLSTEYDKKSVFVQKGTISAFDTEELLVSFLNEIIYTAEKNNAVVISAEVSDIGLKKIVFNIKAGKRVLNKSNPVEVKAATYHRLKIVNKKPGYEAEVVFDV